MGTRKAGAPYLDPDAFAEHAPKDGSWWPVGCAWFVARSGATVEPTQSGHANVAPARASRRDWPNADDRRFHGQALFTGRAEQHRTTTPKKRVAGDSHKSTSDSHKPTRRNQDATKRPEARQRVPSHLATGRRRPCRRRRAAVRADHARLRGRNQRQAADRYLAGRLGR